MHLSAKDNKNMQLYAFIQKMPAIRSGVARNWSWGVQIYIFG
jgi:hypothetical protein